MTGPDLSPLPGELAGWRLACTECGGADLALRRASDPAGSYLSCGCCGREYRRSQGVWDFL
ncbi:MAG: hypothetical protein ACE5EL_02910, partial [Anaerolineae bacterium]